MCSQCTSSSTPTRPSRSSTAPRCRTSWRAPRRSSATSAMALTDHNGVSGSMEFAQAAAPLGLRAIHGAEVELEDGRHLTLLVETEQGWRNLCHLLTRAHAHTRGAVDECAEDREARQAGRGRHQSLVGTRMRRVDVPPQLPSTRLAEHAGGLVCLSGCAINGVHDEPTAARAAGRFRARPSARRAAAAVPARRPRAQPRAGRTRGPARRADGRHRQRPRARARARAAAGRVRRPAQPHDARRIGAPAPRQLLARARPAGSDGRAVPRVPGRPWPRPWSSPRA